jgi:hypothetical protein
MVMARRIYLTLPSLSNREELTVHLSLLPGSLHLHPLHTVEPTLVNPDCICIESPPGQCADSFPERERHCSCSIAAEGIQKEYPLRPQVGSRPKCIELTSTTTSCSALAMCTSAWSLRSFFSVSVYHSFYSGKK